MASLPQKCLAECLGVYILCSFGNGAVAQTLLYSGDKAGLLDIHLAYGMVVTLAVYVTGKVSGAHLNPAVTLAECVFGRFEWRHAPHYFLSQILGGFISSVMVWLVYMDMDKDMTTAGIFATYPRDDISLIQALIDEIIGTIMLVLCLHALVDNDNTKPPAGFEPFFVGITVFTIGAAFGINTGYAINPARDLGPRLFTLVAGWGGEVFSRGNNKVWKKFQIFLNN